MNKTLNRFKTQLRILSNRVTPSNLTIAALIALILIHPGYTVESNADHEAELRNARMKAAAEENRDFNESLIGNGPGLSTTFECLMTALYYKGKLDITLEKWFEDNYSPSHMDSACFGSQYFMDNPGL